MVDVITITGVGNQFRQDNGELVTFPNHARPSPVVPVIRVQDCSAPDVHGGGVLPTLVICMGDSRRTSG